MKTSSIPYEDIFQVSRCLIAIKANASPVSRSRFSGTSILIAIPTKLIIFIGGEDDFICGGSLSQEDSPSVYNEVAVRIEELGHPARGDG